MGTKITDLTALATAPDTLDVIAIVDVDDPAHAASGTTKKITIADLGFLATGADISLLNNDSGFITVSDFSNNGENAGVNRDLGNLDAFALSFITSGVGRINIEAGGNVGIGLTGASEKLEVAGSIKMVDGNQALGKVITSDANGVGSWDNVVGGIFEASNNGSVVPTTYAFNIQDTLAIRGVSSSPLATFTSGTGLEIGDSAGTTSVSLKVNTASANAFVMQRVGVDLLKVTYNSAHPTLRMFNSINGEVVNIGGSAFAAYPTYFIAPGNFGIGTATPTEKLEVVGNTYVNGLIGCNVSPIAGQALTINSTGSSTEKALQIRTNTGTERFFIQGDGKSELTGRLGINDTTVQGAQNYMIWAKQDVTASKLFGLADNAGNLKMEMSSVGRLTLNSNDTGTQVGFGVNSAFSTTVGILGKTGNIYALKVGVGANVNKLNVKGNNDNYGVGIMVNGTDATNLKIGASTTTHSSINFVNGAAPTSPNNGDFWFDGTDLFIQVSGTTYTLTKT